MTRQEFIEVLSSKLAEDLSSDEILSQIHYYEGYIDGEKSRGRSEEEILDDLGDPYMIARTILEAPGSDAGFFGMGVPSAEEAYAEGSYEGQNSSEPLRKTEVPETDFEGSDEDMPDEAGAFETDMNMGEGEKEDTNGPAESEGDPVEKVNAHVVKEGFFYTEEGDFNWRLLVDILSLILILILVIWLFIKAVSILWPIILIGIGVTIFLHIFRS